MLERDIVTAIKAYLRTLGADVFFWKEHGGPYGTSGVPDIICCYRGRFLGLEAKLPGGRLTVLQERAIEKINAAGGIARRVESVEDVRAIIQQVDAKRKNMAPLVYVCSPYRGDVKTNTANAQAYCRLVMKRGGIPFAPHLLFTQFLDDSKAEEREQGMRMGLQMLKRCNELWAFGTLSAGMRAEIDEAKRIGAPVRYFDAEGNEKSHE